VRKFYKYLLLIAWFTVGIAETQKLVGQNQVQTFTCQTASVNDDAEEALSSGRIEFTSSNLKITEDSNARDIYFLHQIVKGEKVGRKSMNHKIYRSIYSKAAGFVRSLF
jgi:hypothetical protein